MRFVSRCSFAASCRRRRPLGLLACLAVAVALGPAAAQASTAAALGLTRLVRESDATVLGRVESASSFWQGTRIYTLARVRVDEIWAGSTGGSGGSGHTLSVLTLGGRVGDIGQRVEGAAQLTAERQVVLHLRAHATGEFTPYGMAQGLWEVEGDPAAGTLRPGTVRGAQRVHRHVDRLVGRGAPATARTLAQLKQAVVAAAARPDP